MSRFTGDAAPLTPRGVEACAHTLSVHPAELWSVLHVEARGCGYFKDRRPVILFERHIFSRRTQGRFDTQAPDLSHPKAGGYVSGVAEYERLERALALDAHAALMSASWGLGQVMGFNAEELGYGSVEQFVQRMMASEDEQLAALTAFIQHNGLAKALREHDWAAFARGYNGPAYEKNQYDKKLAEAYQRLSTHPLPDLSVREGQLRLMFLGFEPGGVDGVFGAHTKTALHQFQGQQRLAPTEHFEPDVLEALRRQHAQLPRGEAPSQAPAPTPPPRELPAPLPPPPPPVTRAPELPAPPVVIPREPPAPLPSLPPGGEGRPEAIPLPAHLAELLRQRLGQPLGEDVQGELVHLLAMREPAARELGPKVVETLDLGLTALLAETPNVAFVRGLRRRIASRLADHLYPLRPLPLLRSESPATQVVLGLGLLLLAAHGATALIQWLLTKEAGLFAGFPVRLLLLLGMCGASGSVVSMLMRLGDFERLRGASRTSMVMLGFFKPVVGLYCALFAFALMKSGLLPLQPATPDAELYLFMAVCFLVGFSERLAQDLFSRAEERFTAAGRQRSADSAAPARPPSNPTE